MYYLELMNLLLYTAALHEALTAEVQRLRFENMELRDEGRTSNGIHNMFQIQHQQLSVSESTTTD